MKKKIVLLLVVAFVSFVYAQEITISTAAGQQFSPDIASDGTDFMVVWEDARAGTGNPNIYGRIVTADGETPGLESPVCAFTGYQRLPSVSFGSEYYLAVWSDMRSGYKVYGNLIQDDGMLYLGNFPIATAGGSIQEVRVSGHSGGEFLVVWEERISGISHIKACVTGEDMISTAPIDLSDSPGNQKSPSVAWNGSQWYVVFEDSTSSDMGIFGVGVSSSGSRIGSPILLTEGTNDESNPALAYDGDGYFLVYEHRNVSMERDIYGIMLDSSGSPEGSPFPISTATDDQTKPICIHDSHGFLISWQDTRDVSSDIYCQYLSPGGTLIESDFTATDIAGARLKVRGASNGSHFVVVWEDNRSATTDLYASRIESATESESPEVTILQPTPSLITSCNRYPVKMLLEDPDEIDEYSILVRAISDTFSGYSSYIVMHDDTMIFSPPFHWPDGDSIYFCLLDVADMSGNHIESPVCWYFFADRQAPVATNEIPRNGQVVSEFPAAISLNLFDVTSEVDPNTIVFQYDGELYSYPDAHLNWDDYTIRLYPEDTSDGDHSVRVWFGDSPDVCDPNIGDLHWSFHVGSDEGPVASPVSPYHGSIVASDSPYVKIKLLDDDGIDVSTIHAQIACFDYYWPHNMNFHDSLLTIWPDNGFPHASEVTVSLLHAQDTHGNDLEGPLNYTFLVDTESPEILELIPAPMGTLRVGIDDIQIVASDEPAGLTANFARVGFDFYDLSSTLLESPLGGITLIGDSIILQSGAFGPALGDENSIEICLHLMDNVDLYSPNQTDTCWLVYIQQMEIDEGFIPKEFALRVYPNPFNSSCRIESPGPVEIYDINGNLISRFDLSYKNSINWTPPNDIGSGVFLVKTKTENGFISKRVLLIK